MVILQAALEAETRGTDDNPGGVHRVLHHVDAQQWVHVDHDVHGIRGNESYESLATPVSASNAACKDI